MSIVLHSYVRIFHRTPAGTNSRYRLQYGRGLPIKAGQPGPSSHLETTCKIHHIYEDPVFPVFPVFYFLHSLLSMRPYLIGAIISGL